MQKNISVIVVANDNFESLEKVIWSYNTQAFRNFEMIIVNQNSDETISKSITSIQKEVFFPIVLLNFDKENNGDDCVKKAIEIASTNYILITNSNCLARPDFVEQHIKNRVEGYFLNGVSYSINALVSDKISQEIIYSSKCFQMSWLKSKGIGFFRSFMISYSGLLSTFLDAIFSKNDISSDNLSGWKSDFIQINSFTNLKINNLKEIDLKQKNIKSRAILLKLQN